MAIGSTTEFAKVGESIQMKVTFQKIVSHRIVDISSVTCVGCNLIHLLDADGHCEFCRRRLAHPAKTTWELVKGLIFKDRESVLPPSVVSD